MGAALIAISAGPFRLYEIEENLARPDARSAARTLPIEHQADANILLVEPACRR
jgi:hypothetical protein